MWFQYNLNKQKNSNSLKFTLSIEIAYKKFYVKNRQYFNVTELI